MKYSDIKVGQLLGVHFPYSDSPEKKYGHRVLRLIPTKNPERFGVVTQNVKTLERVYWEWFTSEDLAHWKIVEGV